jgi:hypothetical protein
MFRVGSERGDENEVLDTRLPRRLDKVPIAFEVHALRVVLTPAPDGVGRCDHRLYAF